MSNHQNIQRKLSFGVSSWLAYEFSCNRGNLFNEKYLSYPIGNILNGLTDYQVRSEVNHPHKNTNNQGRPLQIDFVLSDRNNREKWKIAIESKWVGQSEVRLKDIYWDLIRLQNIHREHNDIKTYFLISGFYKKLDVMFSDFDLFHSGKQSTSNRTKNKIVKKDRANITINLRKADSIDKNDLNKRIKKYSNFLLYQKKYCKTAHIYPEEKMFNMTISTIVFEVKKPEGEDKVREL